MRKLVGAEENATLALLVMTDGRRDCISQAIPSALDHLKGRIDQRIIHDDSGDPDYREWLRTSFPSFDLIHTDQRRGFAGAYANAWRYLASTDHTWVFSTEDDFTFNRDVPLRELAAVSWMEPKLVQIALRRQPWNDAEKAAGGVIEQHPEDYKEREIWIPYDIPDWGPDPVPCAILEHRRYWTTNPSLHRVEVCRRGWPECETSEGVFTHQLLKDPEIRFAHWGWRSQEPWVTHIGNVRVGTGY